MGEESAVKNRTVLYLAASASAELFADAALCPFEAVKVRVQTTPPSMGFPTGMGAAFSRIVSTEGVGGLYKGIVPLWGRQVPYTMVKFACFERTVEAFYTYVFTNPKESYTKATQLSITFASGYIAGVFCALVSHPADTMVSKMNAADMKGMSPGQIYSKIGFGGLWKGLTTRIIMVGTLTGLQWWIYGECAPHRTILVHGADFTGILIASAPNSYECQCPSHVIIHADSFKQAMGLQGAGGPATKVGSRA